MENFMADDMPPEPDVPTTINEQQRELIAVMQMLQRRYDARILTIVLMQYASYVGQLLIAAKVSSVEEMQRLFAEASADVATPAPVSPIVNTSLPETPTDKLMIN